MRVVNAKKHHNIKTLRQQGGRFTARSKRHVADGIVENHSVFVMILACCFVRFASISMFMPKARKGSLGLR